MSYCALCLLNGDLRPAKPWDGSPCCGRCQTEMKVRARWFKNEMFKPDISKLSADELVLWRHGAQVALNLFASTDATFFDRST